VETISPSADMICKQQNNNNKNNNNKNNNNNNNKIITNFESEVLLQ
jgi:hypothetical protein